MYSVPQQASAPSGEIALLQNPLRSNAKPEKTLSVREFDNPYNRNKDGKPSTSTRERLDSGWIWIDVILVLIESPLLKRRSKLYQLLLSGRQTRIIPTLSPDSKYLKLKERKLRAKTEYEIKITPCPLINSQCLH